MCIRDSKRGRDYENSISIDYLSRLNERYEAWISTYDKSKLIVFDVDEIDFVEKIHRVYRAIKKVSPNPDLNDKNTIGFVGAPWTILVYMINKISPKNGLAKNFFNDYSLIKILLEVIEKFIKLHTAEKEGLFIFSGKAFIF